MNKDTPQSNTDWREEFDRRWPAFSVEGDHSQYSEGLYAPDRENLADFISQLLEAEKERWREEVEGEKIDESKINKEGWHKRNSQ